MGGCQLLTRIPQAQPCRPEVSSRHLNLYKSHYKFVKEVRDVQSCIPFHFPVHHPAWQKELNYCISFRILTWAFLPLEARCSKGAQSSRPASIPETQSTWAISPIPRAELFSGVHPDRICDRVSDAVLDACPAHDPLAKVAVRRAVRPGLIFVFDSLKTRASIIVSTDRPQRSSRSLIYSFTRLSVVQFITTVACWIKNSAW